MGGSVSLWRQQIMSLKLGQAEPRPAGGAGKEPVGPSCLSLVTCRQTPPAITSAPFSPLCTIRGYGDPGLWDSNSFSVLLFLLAWFTLPSWPRQPGREPAARIRQQNESSSSSVLFSGFACFLPWALQTVLGAWTMSKLAVLPWTMSELAGLPSRDEKID